MIPLILPELCAGVDEWNQLLALEGRLHLQLLQSHVLKFLTLVLDLQISLRFGHVAEDGGKDLGNQITLNCGLERVGREGGGGRGKEKEIKEHINSKLQPHPHKFQYCMLKNRG